MLSCLSVQGLGVIADTCAYGKSQSKHTTGHCDEGHLGALRHVTGICVHAHAEMLLTGLGCNVGRWGCSCGYMCVCG